MAARKPSIVLERVPITGAGANGKALARVDGMVVFVSGAIPGDVVDLRVTRRKKSYMEAVAQRLVEPSPDRVDPFCKHFGTCGGCKWQDLAYPKQLEYKQQQVIDNLTRLGGLELPVVDPILASPRTTHYRNKLEFTFGAHRWLTGAELRSDQRFTDRNALGFHIPQRFDRVLDIDECHLQPEPSDSMRRFVRQKADELKLSFYDVRAHEGFLRNLLIRTTTTVETMVLFAFGHEDVRKREALLGAFTDRFPETTSVLWTINPKKNDTIWDLDVHVHRGRDHLVEVLPDDDHPALRFRIGPKTFFQTNPEQALVMYRRVRELSGLSGGEHVYDLYCGAGSITLFLARHSRSLVGLEIVPEAVGDAEANAALNGIDNTRFFSGDLKDLLTPDFTTVNGRPDVVVTDPPRAGMHEDVVRALNAMAPDRIVYVSCNPATQARDLSLLKDKYTITAVQPVDMFPHTFHVENIVRLERIEQ